jgi:hypothetical protein
MTTDGEKMGIWKEVFVVYLKALSHYLLWVDWLKLQRISLSKTSVARLRRGYVKFAPKDKKLTATKIVLGKKKKFKVKFNVFSIFSFTVP